MPEPISEEKREAIIRLAEAGDVPRKEIARQVGVGLATVSRVAHQVGLSFSRRATSAATKARQADMLAARMATAECLLDDVTAGRELLLAEMDETQLRWSLAALAVGAMDLVRSSLVRKGSADPDGALVALVREQILAGRLEADDDDGG